MTRDGELPEPWAPLLWVAALAFLILLSYGLARSTVDSLLLHDGGKEAMKYAYGGVALTVIIVVALYARAAATWPIGSLLMFVSIGSAAILGALLILRLLGVTCASYGLYVWKDVYVVVLVELTWTLANSAFKQATANWAYGFFCVAGTLGDMSGSFVAQRYAPRIGSAELLWLVPSILFTVAIVGRSAARACGWPSPKGREVLQGVTTVLRASRAIQLFLVLVATIQVVTTVIDYMYKTGALDAYPLLDERTAVFARVDMIIGASSMALQLVSGAFVTLLGLRLLVVVLPAMVGAAALYHTLHPAFLSLATLKIVNKSLDYSLFRTTKELLYRPLSYEERTQGKAAVDIFGYRVAKGGASGLLVAVSASLSLIVASGICLWMLLAIVLATQVGAKSARSRGTI